MASPAASTAALDLLDPADFPTRDDLINFLMREARWSSSKVGEMFELSDRQARRIVSKMPPWQPTVRDEAPALTRAEAESMLRDLSGDPYASPEERELVDAWITSHAAMSGIVELSRPGRKDLARRPAKARNAYA